QFLESSLQTAISSTDRYYIIVVIRYDLYFEMPRPVKVFLYITIRVAKSEQSFPLCGGKSSLNFVLVPDNSHATSTTTMRCLNSDWKTVLANKRKDLFGVLYDAIRCDYNRSISCNSDRPRGDFIA